MFGGSQVVPMLCQGISREQAALKLNGSTHRNTTINSHRKNHVHLYIPSLPLTSTRVTNRNLQRSRPHRLLHYPRIPRSRPLVRLLLHQRPHPHESIPSPPLPHRQIRHSQQSPSRRIPGRRRHGTWPYEDECPGEGSCDGMLEGELSGCYARAGFEKDC